MFWRNLAAIPNPRSPSRRPQHMKHAHVLKYVGITLLIAALVVVHVIGLRRMFSHMTWPIMLGVAFVVIAKHVGILRPIYASFKRRSRGSE